MGPPERGGAGSGSRQSPAPDNTDYCPSSSETERSTHDSIHAQLERRREAARRLPPLRCGRRDPWVRSR